MFRNCLKFHEKGTEFYTHGKTLEEYLDKFLEQWLPDYAYETFEKEIFTKKSHYQSEPSTSSGKKRKHPSSHHEINENEYRDRIHEHIKKKKKKKHKKHKKHHKVRITFSILMILSIL